jgi:phosphoglycolate phosphatase
MVRPGNHDVAARGVRNMIDHDLGPPSLVFDLDGTLSDPSVGIGRSINYALAALGYTPISEKTVARYIGPPLDESFREITGSKSAEVVGRLVTKYRERYVDLGYAENVLYPGIQEALAVLGERGFNLGVCTSKRVDFAEQILAMFELREHFRFVSGGEIGVHKHQQLASLLSARTIGPESVMIGDRAVDVLAAKSNGLRSVGVLWGHGSLDELSSAGADSVLSYVHEIVSLRVHHQVEMDLDTKDSAARCDDRFAAP